MAISGTAVQTVFADSHEHRIDPNFEHENKKEVRAFIEGLQEVSREKGIKILANLDEKQAKAVGEAMKPVEYEIQERSMDNQNDVQEIGPASNGKTVVVSVVAKAESGLTAYEFENIMSWTYDGSTVSNVEGDGGPVTTGLPWKYKGLETSHAPDNGDWGLSRQTGHFVMCTYIPTCVVVDNRYPSITLRAEADGSYEIVERDDDT